jgi:hypothetical protein
MGRGTRSFGRAELRALAEAVPIAREMTGQHFALADDWFVRTSHEVCTLRELRAQEILGAGRLAQIRRLERLVEPRECLLGPRGVCPHYRICLQDHNILTLLRREHELCARDLLAYILTHEYVHLVRFAQLAYPYRGSIAGAAEEEARVAEIARAIATRLGPAALRRAAAARVR